MASASALSASQSIYTASVLTVWSSPSSTSMPTPAQQMGAQVNGTLWPAGALPGTIVGSVILFALIAVFIWLLVNLRRRQRSKRLRNFRLQNSKGSKHHLPWWKRLYRQINTPSHERPLHFTRQWQRDQRRRTMGQATHGSNGTNSILPLFAQTKSPTLEWTIASPHLAYSPRMQARAQTLPLLDTTVRSPPPCYSPTSPEARSPRTPHTTIPMYGTGQAELPGSPVPIPSASPSSRQPRIPSSPLPVPAISPSSRQPRVPDFAEFVSRSQPDLRTKAKVMRSRANSGPLPRPVNDDASIPPVPVPVPVPVPGSRGNQLADVEMTSVQSTRYELEDTQVVRSLAAPRRQPTPAATRATPRARSKRPSEIDMSAYGILRSNLYDARF